MVEMKMGWEGEGRARRGRRRHARMGRKPHKSSETLKEEEV
jgi:hypothetical protein